MLRLLTGGVELRREDEMEKKKNTKRKQRGSRRLSDQEVVERFYQKTLPYSPFWEGSRYFWKYALGVAFGIGPFLTLIPAMFWFVLGWPLVYLGIPVGVNAFLAILWKIVFDFWVARKIRMMPSERGTAIICAWYFLLFTWVGFYASLMMLTGVLLSLLKIFWPLSRLWVVVGVYIGVGFGLWKGRRVFLRAIVEGPQAHPWFWPIRLFFGISLGSWILIGVIARILTSIIGQTAGQEAAILSFAGPLLGFSLFLLGLAMTAGISGWLHYQKGRGSSELRV